MSKRVIQRHHLFYQPEVTVDIWKGEHECISKINIYTRKSVSKGFIKALKVFIALNEDRAIDLIKEE